MNHILMYIPNAAKALMYRNLCTELGFRCRALGAADGGKTIAELADIKPMGGTAGTDAGIPENAKGFFVPQELMIFCGLSRSQLDTILDTAKARNLESVKLKAMMTPINSTWTLGRLTLALNEEQKQMEAMKKASAKHGIKR